MSKRILVGAVLESYILEFLGFAVRLCSSSGGPRVDLGLVLTDNRNPDFNAWSSRINICSKDESM